MRSATVRELIEQLNRLSEEELEALRTAVSAELQERDLNGNGAESDAESRGTPGGHLSPAPARESKIRANGWDVNPNRNPAWEWQTVKVACGECGGQGWKKTLLDGEFYNCKACERRGWFELTVPVLRCQECQGPPDERVKAGMRCGRCAYGNV